MKAQLTIVMDETGQVTVTGPLENRMFCYGLLEMAKEVIGQRAAASPAKEPSPIIPVHGHLAPVRR